MSQCQLCHGLRGGLRGVAHFDALLLGVCHVDVVHADAAADDELQLALQCLVDVVLTDLGLGADHYGVKVLQCLAQLVGLIKLFHDLVAHFPQFFLCGFIHSVCNENSHVSFTSVDWDLSLCDLSLAANRAWFWIFFGGIGEDPCPDPLPRFQIAVIRRALPRISSGSPPVPRRPLWAWRCRWRRAVRPRTCGPSGCRSPLPWWRR